jgi:uncharacterized delta-60 repeat protein
MFIEARRRFAGFTLLCLLLLRSPAPAALQIPAPGEVDLAFDAGAISWSFGSGRIHAMLVQPDGRIVIAGAFSSIAGVPRHGLARLHPNGTLDPSFAPPFFPNVTIPFVRNLALQPDGKLIVAGAGLNVGNQYFPVARLNPDGSLDPAFTLQPMAVSRGVEGLLLQPDGRILIGGDFSNIGAATVLTMARLNADGTLDTTFGFGVPLGNYGGSVYTIVRQPDGSILAGGDFFINAGATMLSHLVRLDPNGIPDTTFQPVFNRNEVPYVRAIALRPTGDMYVAGVFSTISGFSVPSMARLTASGAPDPGFNANLMLTPREVEALLLQDDGKLIVTGNFVIPGERRSIARLDETGAFDSFYPPFGLGTVFGGGGIGHALAMQADRKVLVGGEFIMPGGVPRQHIVRLMNDGPANRPPIAVDDAAVTSEDVAVSISVVANDSDPDGDPLTITSAGGAAHGVTAIGPGGTVLYTPAANYFGADSFTYTVDDGRGETETAAVSVTIVPANDPPLTADDTYTVTAESTLTVAAPGVLVNDSDPDGDTLSAGLLVGPASGTLVLQTDGSFTYTPPPGFSGTVTFTYRASDGAAVSGAATVTIAVEPGGFMIAATGQPLPGGSGVFTGFPGAPALAGGLASFAALGTSGQQGLYGCDRFIPVDPCLPVVNLSTPIPGGTGSFSGFGPASAAGTATAFIGAGAGQQGVFLCDRAIPTDPCVPIALTTTAIPGGTGTFTLFGDVALAARTSQVQVSPIVAFLGGGVGQQGVFVCDRTQPGDPCRPIATLATAIPGGTGAFESFSGLAVSVDIDKPDRPATLAFIGGATGQAGVYRCEAGPGDPCQPVATRATAIPGGTGTFSGFSQVAASGRFTSFIATGSGQAGVYSCDAAAPTEPCQPAATLMTAIPGGAGTFTGFDAVSTSLGHTAFLGRGASGQAGIYVASTLRKVVAVGDVLTGRTIASLRFGRDGIDGDRLAFAVTFTDGSEGVFIVDLNLPLNRSPIALADQASVHEDATVTVDLVANDADPDGDVLAISAVSAPGHGIVVATGSRSIRYTPTANYFGPDAFTYTVSDGRGGLATASVGITVLPVNDRPVAATDSYSTTAGAALTVAAPGVLANDTDLDGGTLSAVLVAAPAAGTLTLNASGSFTYLPAANFTGVVTFSYAASDGLAASPPAVASITVLPAAGIPSWRFTASLRATSGGSAARSGHTATLLPNGRVLVVGGAGGVDAVRHAQLYDPATRTWSLGALTGESRSGHTATLLPNGKVLVVGGFLMIGTVPVALLDTCALYDPASDRWLPTSSLLPTAAGSTGRALHTATLLANGKVLVAGGVGTSVATPRSAQLYDPATGRWSHASALPESRAGHTATRLANGRVLLTGGLNVLASAVPIGFRDSAVLYDPASGAWSSTGRFVQTAAGPQGRTAHTATLLPDGRVLVVGGAGSNPETPRRPQIYDSATGRWSLGPLIADGRMNHTATLLPDGRVLVAGGFRVISAVPLGFLASSVLYDPASNAWSATASLNAGRAIHTATLLPDGTVLAVAGESATGRVASAEIYWR